MDQGQVVPIFSNPLSLGWVIVFTALGVMGFWAKWGRSRLRVAGLSEVLRLVPISEPWQPRVEFATFLVVSCLVGIGVVQPTTVPQCLTAGFAWTGLVAKMPKPEAVAKTSKGAPKRV